MARARSIHPTLYEALKDVNELGFKGRGKGKSAVEGLKPKTFPLREGTQTITPEQMLSIRVPIQKISHGNIQGYQRALKIPKARRFARWILSTPQYEKQVPAVEVSLTDNMPFATDGEHRLAGAIMARKPLKILVTKRTEKEAKGLFVNQGEGERPNRNNLIFNGSGPYEEYIQDAVTSQDHAWSGLISTAQTVGGGTNRISATAAMGMLRIFVGRSLHNAHTTKNVIERFDKDQADMLATLLSAFGTRQTNPIAFSGSVLRSIAMVARYVFIDREPHPGDVDRWVRHMSRFPFPQYAYVRGQREWAEKLLKWWNRQLSEDRKARMPD